VKDAKDREKRGNIILNEGSQRGGAGPSPHTGHCNGLGCSGGEKGSKEVETSSRLERGSREKGSNIRHSKKSPLSLTVTFSITASILYRGIWMCLLQVSDGDADCRKTNESGDRAIIRERRPGGEKIPIKTTISKLARISLSHRGKKKGQNCHGATLVALKPEVQGKSGEGGEKRKCRDITMRWNLSALLRPLEGHTGKGRPLLNPH